MMTFQGGSRAENPQRSRDNAPLYKNYSFNPVKPGKSCLKGGTFYLRGTTFHPGGTTFHPGGTTFHLKGPTFHPGGPTFNLRGTTFHPGGTTFHPGGPTFHPGGTTFHLRGTTFHLKLSSYTYIGERGRSRSGLFYYHPLPYLYFYKDTGEGGQSAAGRVRACGCQVASLRLAG